MTVYAGFAEGLEDIDQELVSDSQILTPSGRAYLHNGAAYHESVHMASVEVIEEPLLELQRKFRQNAEKYNSAVYAGAAGFMNLSYMAAMKPAASILFDVNFLQKPFWQMVINALAENPDVEGFKDFVINSGDPLREKIKHLFNDNADGARRCSLGRLSNIGQLSCDYKSMETASKYALRDWLKEGERGLSPDLTWQLEGYDHLHRLAKHGAIGAITMDVNDLAAAKQLKRYLDDVRYKALEGETDDLASGLEQQGAQVSVLHISNIFLHLGSRDGSDWTGRKLGNASIANARANLETFMSPNPIVMDDFGAETWPVYSLG